MHTEWQTIFNAKVREILSVLRKARSVLFTSLLISRCERKLHECQQIDSESSFFIAGSCMVNVPAYFSRNEESQNSFQVSAVRQW